MGANAFRLPFTTATRATSSFVMVCARPLRQACSPRSLRSSSKYGLPARIRSDNAVPFATIPLGRLSELSARWARLGILPVLFTLSSTQQHGRHECMHRTQKRRHHTAQGASPGAAAPLQRLPRRAENQASARGAWTGEARELVSCLRVPLPGAAPGPREPGPLRGTLREPQPWHPLAQLLSQPEPRARRGEHGLREDRRRDLKSCFRAAHDRAPRRAQTTNLRRKWLLQPQPTARVSHQPWAICHQSSRPPTSPRRPSCYRV